MTAAQLLGSLEEIDGPSECALLLRGHFIEADAVLFDCGIVPEDSLLVVKTAKMRIESLTNPAQRPILFLLSPLKIKNLADVWPRIRARLEFAPDVLSVDGRELTTLEEIYDAGDDVFHVGQAPVAPEGSVPSNWTHPLPPAPRQDLAARAALRFAEERDDPAKPQPQVELLADCLRTLTREIQPLKEEVATLKGEVETLKGELEALTAQRAADQRTIALLMAHPERLNGGPLEAIEFPPQPARPRRRRHHSQVPE
jgi:uncharacterized small protein (DUF1192 family)